MHGINEFNSETFELETRNNKIKLPNTGIEYFKARPEGKYGIANRLFCAYKVFTGKVDIIEFKGQ